MRVVINTNKSLVEVPLTEQTLSILIATSGKAMVKFHGGQLHSIGCQEGSQLTLMGNLPELWHTDLTYLLYIDNYTLRFATSQPCDIINLPVVDLTSGEVKPEGNLGGITTETDTETGLDFIVFGNQSDYYGNNAVVEVPELVEDFPNKDWLIGEFPSATMVATDLGLSVDWGSLNLGATNETEAGMYIPYGFTDEPQDLSELFKGVVNGVTYDGKDPFPPLIDPMLQYILDHQEEIMQGGQESVITALNSIPNSFSTVTPNSTQVEYEGTNYTSRLLKPELDIVTQTLGPGWRLPTLTEVHELIDNTTQSIETIDNVRVIKFTSTVPGYTGNYIVIPIGGGKDLRESTDLTMDGQALILNLKSLWSDSDQPYKIHIDFCTLLLENDHISSRSEISEGYKGYEGSQDILTSFMSENGITDGSYGNRYQVRFISGNVRGVREK